MRHLYWSGVGYGVDLRMDTQKKDIMCLIEIGLHAQILLSILGSIVNIIWGGAK